MKQKFVMMVILGMLTGAVVVMLFILLVRYAIAEFIVKDFLPTQMNSDVAANS